MILSHFHRASTNTRKRVLDLALAARTWYVDLCTEATSQERMYEDLELQRQVADALRAKKEFIEEWLENVKIRHRAWRLEMDKWQGQFQG